MKFRRLLLSLFALAGSAAAQFTVVTGTVTDPNGLAYANGTISAGLVYPGGTTVTLSGQPYSAPSGATALDGSGKFTMRLGDNTVLLPSGTTWTFLICSAAGTVQPAGGKGPVCFNVPALTISGSSQSITSNITAVPPPALTVNPGTGTLSSVACTSPETCTPSPIVASGTISCPTCATTTSGGALSGTSPITVSSGGAIGCATCGIGPGSSTANDVAGFASTDGVTLKDLGAQSFSTYFGTCGGVAISNGTTSVVGFGTSAASAATCAVSLGNPATTLQGLTPVTRNCTLKNLTLVSSANGVNSSDGVATIWTGNFGGTLSSTALTCTFGATKVCRDSTHTVSITAGQVIEVAIVTQTSSTLTGIGFSIDCQ